MRDFVCSGKKKKKKIKLHIWVQSLSLRVLNIRRSAPLVLREAACSCTADSCHYISMSSTSQAAWFVLNKAVQRSHVVVFQRPFLEGSAWMDEGWAFTPRWGLARLFCS